MNNITIAGNIGRDAEVRVTPKGESVASFSVADSQGRYNVTIWWRCTLWGKRADSLAPYLMKGAQVTVSGTVTEREWKDKDGTPKKSMEIRVSDIALQGGKAERQEPAKQTSRPASQSPALRASSGFEDMDDDIPFSDPMKSRAYCLALG